MISKQPILSFDAKSGLFILEEAYFYEFQWSGEWVWVPRGTVTNFASVPWIVRWLINPTDKDIVIAALIHDYLVNEFVAGDPVVYWIDGEDVKEYTPDWKESSYIMKKIMQTEGQPNWKRTIVWVALRLYGLVQRKK